MTSICCIPLPGLITKKFLEAGFLFVEDLHKSNNELHPDAEKILKKYPEHKAVVQNFLTPLPSITAEDLLKIEKECQRILTFSLNLDELLGGGVPLGSVLELCGSPGSGKTQLCMQLCLSVQLHKELEGLQAAALYIDTDSGFSPQRFEEICSGCRDHCCKVAKFNKFSDALFKELENQTFSNYFFKSVNGHSQLLATVLSLDSFLQLHNEVKLVIIDSLVFPFYRFTDMLKRTSLVCRIIQHLKILAQKYSISVVVTNHLTTRISKGEEQLVPALGECYGHLINCRLMLGYLPYESHFGCVLYKSPSLPSDSAKFLISKGGIRDCK